MAKVLILYHSGTGNTQKMAEAVAEGVESVQGLSIELKTDMDVSPEDLASFDAIAVGGSNLPPRYVHRNKESL